MVFLFMGLFAQLVMNNCFIYRVFIIFKGVIMTSWHPGKVERCPFPPLDFKYQPEHSTALLNNGHTAMVKIEGSGDKGR